MSNYDALLRSFGPSAWWKLADPVGSGVAADSSGNGWIGTVNGAVTFGQPGPLAGNSSALFNGTSGNVTSALSSGALVSFTAMGWISPTAMSGTPDLITARSAGNADGVIINPNSDGTVSFGASVYNSNNSYAFESTHRPLNAWYFAVASYSATAEMFLYVNGAMSFSEPTWTGGSTLAANWEIAGGYNGTHHPDGSIAEAAVFPYALSAAQVAALWSPPQLVSGGSGWPHLVYR